CIFSIIQVPEAGVLQSATDLIFYRKVSGGYRKKSYTVLYFFLRVNLVRLQQQIQF
ncbi:MAG: hypothetical protein AVDCRST_MAG96-2501, partial [uncultured Segetibacter sp.]